MKINGKPFSRRAGLPLHAHPSDPAAVHERAVELGESAADAQGGLADATVGEVIDVLIEAAKMRGFTGNVDSLRTRLTWTVRDAREARERARRPSERAIRRAALEGIAAGMSARQILAASLAENKASEPQLSAERVAVLVDVEIALECRRRECPRCSSAELATQWRTEADRAG